MSLTLAEVFNDRFKHVKFDTKLAKALYKYQIGYVNRNHDHLEFFGSNLLGVHVVRFKDSDVLKFYDEVLDIDFYELTEAVRKVDTINHEFKISGDVLNLTLMYIIHRIFYNSSLNDKDKKRAAYDTALIFFYRSVAALISYYFKYPADPKIAQAAYAELSNKFLIKKLGSWHKVMDYRANDLIDDKSIHFKNLVKFNDDFSIVYAINDSQGRVKDLIKNYYAVFIAAHEEGNKIGTTSSTYFDAEGEETIKEKTKSVEAYVSYMQSAIIDEHTFVKDELVSVISKVNTNTSFRMVKYSLSWLCKNYNDGKVHNSIDEFVRLIVVHSFYLINNYIEPKHYRDYPHILTQLKNLYLSTRSEDPELIKIRELGESLILKANGRVSNSLALATRTSLILYITLRALVGQSKK